MDDNRIREMEELWWAESADPSTEAWRNSLTANEAALVAKWDALCAAGVTDMAQYAAASDEWR